MDDRYWQDDEQEDPDEPLDEGLDEYLCEYVDGSMDPVVRQAFEEYLGENPHLADHVRCLCQARRLLSTDRSCPHAPKTLQQRLKAAIARDLLGATESNYRTAVTRLGMVAGVTSAAGLMLMLGMLFGTAIVAPRTQADRAAQPAVERTEVPSDAHGHRYAAPRLPARSRVIQAVGLAGPVSALPTLASSPFATPILWPDSLVAPPVYHP